jgi:hypothetical protein
MVRNNNKNVKFEVLKAMNTWMSFWDVTPCGLAARYITAFPRNRDIVPILKP